MTDTTVTPTNPDPTVLVGPTAERLDNDNDRQMMERWDGAWGISITRRALEQEAKFVEQNDEELIRSGAINEPVPLATVNVEGEMEIHNPVRIVAMKDVVPPVEPEATLRSINEPDDSQRMGTTP